MNRIKRPGPGWKHLGMSVWEHMNGCRIHAGAGVIRLPGKIFLCRYNDRVVEFYIKMTGGNVKRGLMSCAIALQKNNE